MPEQRSWYLVSYDVRDEKRLRKVAKHIEGYGNRVQYSVFRCRLTARSLERLKWELTKVMDKEDNLLVIALCAKCADRIRRTNADESWTQESKKYEVT